jgi:hypothetical protein
MSALLNIATFKNEVKAPVLKLTPNGFFKRTNYVKC